MKDTVGAVRVVEPDEARDLPGLPAELRLALSEVALAAKEGLLAMSVAVGLRVMAEMMENEIAGKAGPKHAKLAGRTVNWHGTAPGTVVLGGRRVKARYSRT